MRDADLLRERLEVAEREQERLVGIASDHEQLQTPLANAELECERLRDELTRMRAENEQSGKEREAVAEQLPDVMNQVLWRLRGAG